jgi:hypothetical protein
LAAKPCQLVPIITVYDHPKTQVILTRISSKAQEAQIRRLNNALHKRQNAEIDIWKQLQGLERSRKALAKLLIEVCHARLETTAEIGTTGRVPKKAPKLVCYHVVLYECDYANGQSSDYRRAEEKLATDIPYSILL